MSKTGSLKVYLMLLMAMLFWGMSFIWFKQAYPGFQPITIILFRLIISFPLLVLFSLLIRRFTWPKKKDLKFFFLIAFFEPLMYFLGESFGLKYISSTLASTMIATIPLFTPFTAYYFFRQKISVNKYLGIIVSFFGVLMVIYIDGSSGQAPFIGIALMILAILSTQGYAVILKRLSDSYNVFSIISIQNMIGALYFIPFFFMHEAKEFSWKAHTLIDYLPVFYLAIFASTFAFLFFAKGLKNIGMTKAIVFTNFIPIVTSIFAVFILHEVMSLMKVAGILLTIAGVLMSQVESYPKIRIFKSDRIK